MSRSIEFGLASDYKLPDTSDVFSFYEIFSEHLLRRERSFYPLLARDLIDSHLCSLLPGEAMKMRLEFIRQLIERAKAARSINCFGVSLRFDQEAMLTDGEYEQNLRLILHCISGFLAGEKMKLYLSMRFPADLTDGRLEALNILMHRLLSPEIEFIFDIYIHEQSFVNADWATLLKKIGINTRNFRFVYEPEQGNRFSTVLIRKIAENIPDGRQFLRFVIAPVCTSQQSIEAETGEITQSLRGSNLC